MTAVELDKLAMRLVAVDRQTAGATRAAIRSWSAKQKATPRAFGAMRFAESLAEALDKTTVKR